MVNYNAYWRLARLDKPIGIILLWSPTSWALWLANHGHPSIKIIIFFLLGTIIMRSAGCVINDIADRNFDLHVSRTNMRPLTSGEVSLVAAFLFFILLVGCAVIILLQLPPECFLYALLSLLITVIYPFCKRMINSPQLILSIAFSMSMPMVYVTAHQSFDKTLLMLWLINFLWVIAYDTQYAMVDLYDDKKIAVKSTAVFFKSWSKTIIVSLQIVLHFLWLPLAWLLDFNNYFFILWFFGGCLFIYQYNLLYMQAFLNNSWYGLIMWFAIICG